MSNRQNLQTELLALSEKQRLYIKTGSQKLFLAKRMDEEKARERELKERLKKEKKDFDRLERFSLQYLFHSILQNIESQKDKEKQEWLVAQLQWEQCSHELEVLEKEYKEVAERYSTMGDVTEQYNQFFSEKVNAINAKGDTSIKDISERLAKKEGEKQEVREAMEVGDQLIKQLEVAGQYLNSASNWGTWDLLGGGLIATAIKRGKMDDARDAMQKAQHLLNQFNKELGDVNATNIELAAGGFSAFADYFFDGLIVDWIVQSSINKASRSVGELYERVQEVNKKLSERETIARSEFEKLQQEYRDMVESANL